MNEHVRIGMSDKTARMIYLYAAENKRTPVRKPMYVKPDADTAIVRHASNKVCGSRYVNVVVRSFYRTGSVSGKFVNLGVVGKTADCVFIRIENFRISESLRRLHI